MSMENLWSGVAEEVHQEIAHCFEFAYLWCFKVYVDLDLYYKVIYLVEIWVFMVRV